MKLGKLCFGGELDGKRFTSFVDVVGENSGGANQYTGDSTGTAHEHQYEDYALRHMRLANVILRRSR